MLDGISDDCFSHHSAHLYWMKIVSSYDIPWPYWRISLTTLLDPVARCSVKDNKTWDKDGFLDGIRDSMFSHILTIFTAFDGDSLVTPLSKDGFELTSIAKKLYKSRLISSFDLMIWFGVGGHGRSLILCNILVAKFLIVNWCLDTNACRSETWYQGWILFSMNTQIQTHC